MPICPGITLQFRSQSPVAKTSDHARPQPSARHVISRCDAARRSTRAFLLLIDPKCHLRYVSPSLPPSLRYRASRNRRTRPFHESLLTKTALNLVPAPSLATRSQRPSTVSNLGINKASHHHINDRQRRNRHWSRQAERWKALYKIKANP